MSMRSFPAIPKDLREWGNYHRQVVVTAEIVAPATVGTAQLIDNAVTDAKLRDSAALSVIGRPVNSAGDPSDMTAASDLMVMRRAGTSIGFGLIGSNYISDFTETSQDITAALIVNGTGINWVYDDGLATLTGTVSLGPFTTTDLAEGTNLYFTDERAQDAVGASLTDSSSIDFTYTDASGQITAVVLPAGVNHNALLNYVADQHVAHTGVTITAGAGLTGGGDISATRTLDVGAGTGITVNANDVAITTAGVTNSLLANMAADTIKGRANGAGTGDPTDLTAAQVATIISSAVASALNITSGTYTPTLTNVLNLDASTAFDTHYLRVGSTVVVSGQVSVDPTALAATELRISLPIASNIGANSDVGGAAFASVVTQGAAILGDSVNDAARMLWLATDTGNRSMFFCFAYQVI